MATTNGTKPMLTKLKKIPRNRLAELRERGKGKGGIWLTLEEVAKLRDQSQGWISLQENHKRPLTDEDVVAYAKIYKVQPHQIFANLTVKAIKQTA